MAKRKEKIVGEAPRPRNPVARALSDAAFRPRVVRNAKAYTRKGRRAREEGEA